MSIKQLAKTEVNNYNTAYVDVYKIREDMIAKYSAARACVERGDGTMKNCTLRREICRALDNSSDWNKVAKTDSGRLLYQRVKSNSLENFV
ncbi:hypothetical protein [Vibrio phage XZ1]|uniref:Uncharacterized protein n=3 Tax=Schizotequatrovirus TaxID=1198137 RepID=A0A126HH95_9CAUD|nr:hypothetical protein CF80_gp050 [Vibrio phage VH7D]YP_009201202.1 hypothetical protein AVU32_gp099 [Vibrio phage ValKK3]ALP47234.1 hypothetical protein phiGrn1_0274 [Vibrio phage phi-Grn1]ALP47619.1 hypothetical protein phiST2_0033 [Vibrio phage phi-ST2]UOL51366.1 hypothetical protein [Vibrio phage XZ1]URQ03747.1 hypothetical protein PVA23_370 [Vibrio phage PVA23]AGB06837.1 hypothetical protein [Vibrio phage VH7D]